MPYIDFVNEDRFDEMEELSKSLFGEAWDERIPPMTNYYYIWYEIYENENLVSRDRYPTAYKYKHNAVRRAKRMWSKDLYVPMTKSVIHRKWIVSQTYPWEEVI